MIDPLETQKQCDDAEWATINLGRVQDSIAEIREALAAADSLNGSIDVDPDNWGLELETIERAASAAIKDLEAEIDRWRG